MDERSNRAEVRNPVLGLPSAARLLDLGDNVRGVLRAIFLEMQADARARADLAWRKHKAPMAVYWKAVAVYSGHLARVVGRGRV